MQVKPISDLVPYEGLEVFAYGPYSWSPYDLKDGTAESGWALVRWNPEIDYGDECEPIGGWETVTQNPYKDRMIPTCYVEVPEPLK